MTKIIGKSLFTILLTTGIIACAAIPVIYKILCDSTLSKFPQGHIDGVKSVSVRFDNDEIYLNVHSNRQLTCEIIVNSMNINTLIVRNHKYFPKCKVVNNELIQIVYSGSNHE